MSGVANMKKKLSMSNSLLLAAPLVASLNLGILPSNAAILAGDGIGSPKTQETIAQLDVLDIDAAKGYQSDREVLVTEDLSSNLDREFDKKTQLGEDRKSFWGNLSAEINDIFASESETEFTAPAPINTPVNNVRLSVSNIEAIYSPPVTKKRDALIVLLKSLNIVGDSDSAKNQPSTITDTGKVEPAEINPSPVAEESAIATPTENKAAKVQAYTAGASSQVLKTKTTPKLAQLPPALQGEGESFDFMQLGGAVLGLGFFIWMLFQE
jgi:hypothetical protein